MPRLHPALAGVLVAALSCSLVAVLVLAALSLDSGASRYLFAGVVGLLALGACFALPAESLPTVALVLVVLIPDRVADYSVSPVLMPATVVLGIWVVRRLLARSPSDPVVPGGQEDRRLRRCLTVATVLLVAGMVPLVLVSPSKRFSVAWAVTVALAVAAPLLLGDVDEEARRVRRALPWVGSLVAAYAIVQYLVEQNVVYTPVYEALGLDELQHWSVYRSDASLGHPLVAGLFFATVLPFCTGRWLETGRRSFAVAALLNGLGLVTTVSRGSYIAAAVAVSAVLVVALRVHRQHRFRRVLALAAFIAGGVVAVNSQAFVERGLSAEGLSSLNSRSVLPQIALDAARATHWLGGGPASSLPVAAPYNFQHLPIENAYLQLLIGIGLWGLTLVVLVLVLAAVVALRRGNLAALGALVGYATAIGGFAALDSRRDLVVLLGLLVMLSLQRPDGVRAEAAAAVSGGRRPGTARPGRARVPRLPPAADDDRAGRRPGRRPVPVGVGAPAVLAGTVADD